MVPSSPQYPRDINAAPEAPGGAHVIVTIESIYKLLLDVRDAVGDVRGLSDSRATELGGIIRGHAKDLDDHEHRIRGLEKRVWLAAGIAAGAGFGLDRLVTALSS